MADNDEDLDFTALMQRQGVEPVRAVRAGGKAQAQAPREPARATRAGHKAQAPAPREPAPREPVRATRAVHKAPAPREPTRAAERVPVAAPVVVPVERRGAAVSAEKAEVVAAQAGLVTARAELQAQQHALERTIAERDGLAARVKQLEQERDAALRLLATAEKVMKRRAEPVPSVPAPEVPRISLAEALVARGLGDPEEQAQALAALASTESARRLMETLETRDLAGLRSALERRLALVCGRPGCAAPAGAAVIEVSPARCELCGGSEIQRAATRFMQACEAAGVVRVRFVGGSPNYRTQLEALFPGRGPLTVRTTAGDRRVPLHRSKAQQRSDDLVVIWGATELDHATSGAYRAQFGRVETIAHRGIGRMLDLAAERITAR